MSVILSEIACRLSNPALAEGDGGAQPDNNLSLGGWSSSTPWLGGTLADLFDNISYAEDLALTVDYRCIFIGVITPNVASILNDAVIWIESQVAGGASISIGMDPVGIVDYDSASQQAAIIADENSAPAGVVFSTPITEATALSIGTIEHNKVAGVWIRRISSGGGGLALDGFTLRLKGQV